MDALIKFNFGIYSPDITDDEWAILYSQLIWIKAEEHKRNK